MTNNQPSKYTIAELSPCFVEQKGKTIMGIADIF